MSKGRSLALVTLAYVIAIAVGFGWLCWGPSTGLLLLDTLIADVLATATTRPTAAPNAADREQKNDDNDAVIKKRINLKPPTRPPGKKYSAPIF